MRRYSKIPLPVQATEYKCIYTPNPDRYMGPDSKLFTHGHYYDNWAINDFTILKGSDGCWHAYGITHPRPSTFTDDFHYDENIHDAEYQLFHCSFDCSLAQLAIEGNIHCTEHPKILYPKERPGRPECWAPCMIPKDDQYWIFWSPEQIRYAITEDMFHFQTNQTVLFSGITYLRDPYIFKENDVYTMFYVTDHLCARQSKDLLNWTDEIIVMKNPIGSISAQESPCVIKRGDIYYLLWCVYDGQNGAYDNRTFVYAADSLFDFEGKAPVTMLKGHATEIISEEDRDYIVSVGYPDNGLHIALIVWK